MTIVPISNLIPNNFYLLKAGWSKYFITVQSINDNKLIIKYIYLTAFDELIKKKHFTALKNDGWTAAIDLNASISNNIKFIKINSI
jgi:hypothetical protein